VARNLDADRTMQLITPRRTHAWTASGRARAERRETEGRLADPGRRAIALAKAAGGWEAHRDGDALAIPADLGAAIATTGARSWFHGAAPSHPRTVLRWLVKAQRPDTGQPHRDGGCDVRARRADSQSLTRAAAQVSSPLRRPMG
jgi:uncharacterized protein YdeI (YjbR/CyaY-like superfamily)